MNRDRPATRFRPSLSSSSWTSTGGGTGSTNQPIVREPVHLNSNEAHLGIYELKPAASSALFSRCLSAAHRWVLLLLLSALFFTRIPRTLYRTSWRLRIFELLAENFHAYKCARGLSRFLTRHSPKIDALPITSDHFFEWSFFSILFATVSIISML